MNTYWLKKIKVCLKNADKNYYHRNIVSKCMFRISIQNLREYLIKDSLTRAKSPLYHHHLQFKHKIYLIDHNLNLVSVSKSLYYLRFFN